MTGPGGHIVLVPFHRGLDHLAAALRSLVAQTVDDWQAVVIDDSPAEPGSGVAATACAQVVAEVDDPRITIERGPERLGLAGAFNRCFELAAASSAEFATVLHADDELVERYLAAVAATHRAQPGAACVAPRAVVMDALGTPSRPLADRVKAAMWPRGADRLSGDRGLARLLHGLFLYCPSVSYRTSVLAGVRWDTRWSQVMDLELFCRLLLQGHEIALCDEAVYCYRRHAGSATSHNTATLLRLDEETRLCHEIGEVAGLRGWTRSRWAGAMRTTVRLHGLLQVAGHLRRGSFGHVRRSLVLSFER